MVNTRKHKGDSEYPLISVIVVFFNMGREAPRTLYTLTPVYQNVNPNLYEVLVVDNGSDPPLDQEMVTAMSPNFKYIYLQNTHPSPAMALNTGAKLSKGKLLGFMIDGARMLSPGILHYALRAYHSYKNPVICTLGFHLGPKFQPQAYQEGYNQNEEDNLLESIDWRQNGYELFKISVFAGSSMFGWFQPISESNCLFLKPGHYNDIGGFDESFNFPGGGFVNLDFYSRLCHHKKSEMVNILGEGTFHQFHGGAMTGTSAQNLEKELQNLHNQYFQIRGENYHIPSVRSDFIGHIPYPIYKSLEDSMEGIERINRTRPHLASQFNQKKAPPNQARSETFSKRVIMILGMHRSGTSMLAGTLQEAGMDLGPVITVAPHNQKGNRENEAIMLMQEELLMQNSGSWDNPPSKVEWSRFHTSIRDLFISHFGNTEIWGFKDPRTLFTLDGWLEAIPHAEFVGIFRDPLEVAQSLKRRNNFTLEKSLRLWKVYNKKLIDLHDQYEFPIIEFHKDPALLEQKLELLVNVLELPSRHRKICFFEDRLRHERMDAFSASMPQDIANLYQSLVDRSV